MELVIYNEMVAAIAKCEKVDEAKAVLDKAKALEVYFKQARNRESEIKACNIRMRAERRTGELLKELARMKASESLAKAREAKAENNKTSVVNVVDNRETSEVVEPAPAPKPKPKAKAKPRAKPKAKAAPKAKPKSELAQALEENGISRQMASMYQKVAEVPEEEFEAAMNCDDMPSRRKLLNTESNDKADKDSQWFWGRILDFERDKILEKPADKIVNGMHDHMKETVKRLIPEIIKYLNQVKKEIANDGK